MPEASETKRLIISRKGFDSGTGYKPSLWWKNRLISLPIPQAETGIFYKDLSLNQQHSYLDAMQDLGIRQFSEAHLDPDLDEKVWQGRLPGWRPAFGQSGAALSHLQKEGVGVGDLFLFFGWFREVERQEGCFRYKKKARDLHIMFGYLEVGEVIDLTRQPPPQWAKSHPHVSHAKWLNRQGNQLFVGREASQFFPGWPGAGHFSFHDTLILTDQQTARRSDWRLPACFFSADHHCRLSYHRHKKGHRLDHDSYSMTAVSRGQEFVVPIDAGIQAWIKHLGSMQ